MKRLNQKDGFTIEKENISQTKQTSKIRFFVDHIDGRGFGNYETYREAKEVFNNLLPIHHNKKQKIDFPFCNAEIPKNKEKVK